MDELSLIRSNKSRKNHNLKNNLNINLNTNNDNESENEEENDNENERENVDQFFQRYMRNTKRFHKHDIIEDEKYSRRRTSKTGNLLILSANSSNNNINETHITNNDIKKRKDVYGREIKRGGIHHVSFADDVYEKRVRKTINEYDEYSLTHRRKNLLPAINPRGRKTVSYINDRTTLYKRYKRKKNKNSFYLSPLVYIILIQSHKKETKKMSFILTASAVGKEAVCCSEMCSIY